MPNTLVQFTHVAPIGGFLPCQSMVQRLHNLPRVPVAYRLWMQLMASTARDGDLEVAIPIIRQDPGLTLKLLALANSMEFRGNEPANSLEEAVFRLGTMETLRMVASLVFKETTSDGMPLYSMTQGQFIGLSLGTGFLMQAFCEEAGLSRGEAQGLGMIRGLGHWFLQSSVLDAKLQLPPFEGSILDVADWEKACFDVNHGEFAACVFKMYALPDAMVEPLSIYINAEQQTGQWAKAAALLKLSLWYANQAVMPDRIPNQPLSGQLFDMLGLTKEQFEEKRGALSAAIIKGMSVLT